MASIFSAVALNRPLRWFGALLICGLIAACDSGTDAPRPTTVEISGGDVSASAGGVVTPAPTFVVKDQNGNVMSGVPVTVTVAAGGGTIAGAPTSANGETSVGTWTLGQQAGANQLQIAVEGLDPVVITATATAGPPSAIAPSTQQPISGQVATTLTTNPAGTLTDQFGNPVGGVEINITFDGGNAPASVVTAADGTFSIPGIALGQTSGTFSLVLSTGDASYTFVVVAQPGPPASVEVASGNGQSALAGTNVPQPILIAVRDQFGNGVPGVTVTFAIAEGGGFLRSGTATTGANGLATAPDWALGLSATPQRLRATAGTLSTTVSATIQTSYNIEVIFFGGSISQSRRDAFTQAAARISAIVTGDLGDVESAGIDPSACGADGASAPPAIIDDLVIYASIRPIDGAGGILGSAGPCYIRDNGGLPVVGVMQFDDADITVLENNGTLESIIRHEMLHVVGLGVGRYWNPLLVGKGSNTVAFTGPGALEGCRFHGGNTVCATNVPVENTGGAGTRDGHFRESTFDTELMTGFAESGSMPLSRITIQSLSDIGYTTNVRAADDYSVPVFAIRSSSAELARGAMDAVIEPSFSVAPNGVVRRLVTPISDPAFPTHD